MQRLKELFIFLLSISVCFSCSRDQLESQEGNCVEEITYLIQVRPLIDRTCAYSGCHDGSASAPGDFRTFAGLAPFLNSTKFDQRAVQQRDMPPNYATGPNPLSQEEIKTLICWIENDYQEN